MEYLAAHPEWDFHLWSDEEERAQSEHERMIFGEFIVHTPSVALSGSVLMCSDVVQAL